MKVFFIFLILFLQACGDEQIILERDSLNTPPTFSRSRSVQPKETPEETDLDLAPNPNLPPGTCQDFIQAVVSFEPGPGAEYGQPSYPQIVYGPPKGGGAKQGGMDVLSLGQGGVIVVDMAPCEIADEEGTDFIVFENPFWVTNNPPDPFEELGQVSVSEDGVNFITFPCESENFPYTGCAGWNPVLTNPSNGISPFDTTVAGGDPFDLAEIGVAQARFIKIEDILGFGPPAKAGFDLDAIGVIHGKQVVIASSP